MDTGGDFADGIINFDERRQGGETFVTFDPEAANILVAAGSNVTLLGPPN